MTDAGSQPARSALGMTKSQIARDRAVPNGTADEPIPVGQMTVDDEPIDAEIVASMTDAGMSTRAIGAALGVAQDTVHRIGLPARGISVASCR
jgi:hypothetical protein